MNENEIGICVYCQETVLKGKSSLITDILIHKDCENDILAEIQDQKGQW